MFKISTIILKCNIMLLLDCFIFRKTFKLILLLKVYHFGHFYKQLDSK